MTNQKLIEEAVRKYPRGTIADNDTLGYNCRFTVESVENYFDGQGRINIKGSGSTYTICDKGKWARVVSYPEGVNPEQVAADSYTLI